MQIALVRATEDDNGLNFGLDNDSTCFGLESAPDKALRDISNFLGMNIGDYCLAIENCPTNIAQAAACLMEESHD